MTQVILSNAFSLSMVEAPIVISIREASVSEVKSLIANGFTSAIGHEGTARVLSQLLGVEVPVNRIMVRLMPGTILIVFQLLVRLEEGRILSASEVEELVRSGKAKFFIITQA